MALNHFGIQQIKLNAATADICGVQGQAADYGATVVTRQSDGILQATSRSVAQLAPRASWSTYQPDLMLAKLDGSTLWPMKALDGTNGLQLVGAQAASSDAGYAAGSVHEALTALRGLVWATGFSWGGPNSDLIGAFAAMFTSSTGLADAPALIPAQVALPAQPIPSTGFDLTALTIGGTAVDGVNNWDVSGDPKIVPRWNHGHTYPTKIQAAGLHNPLEVGLRFGVNDLALARSIGAIGTTADIVTTFTRYANDSAARSGITITFTASNCLVRLANPHNGQQGSAIGVEIEALPRADDANPMFSWVVSS